MDEDQLPDEELSGLSDEELEEELTVAAAAPDHRNYDRYLALLAERDRRKESRESRDEPA